MFWYVVGCIVVNLCVGVRWYDVERWYVMVYIGHCWWLLVCMYMRLCMLIYGDVRVCVLCVDVLAWVCMLVWYVC